MHCLADPAPPLDVRRVETLPSRQQAATRRLLMRHPPREGAPPALWARLVGPSGLVGTVALSAGAPVGVLVYQPQIHTTQAGYRVRTMAGDPAWRTPALARLLTVLRGQLGGARSWIQCEVHEADLEVQLVLRALGFRAVAPVLRRHFDDGDGYTFALTVPHRAVTAAPTLSPEQEHP